MVSARGGLFVVRRELGSATTRPRTPASTSAPTTLPSPPSTTVWSLRADAFAATDAALDQRVSAAGLSGGTIRVVADDGTVLHEYSTGAVTPSTALDLASSTKWLTAATLMTFVDRGAIALDDDIARWLPEFAGSDPPIRVRQLLDHTSGVHDNPCQNGGMSLSACVTTLASSPREFAAGSAFSYGNSPYLVVGRLVEVLGGADFASVVHDRLTGPLGMADTTWPGAPSAPNPAFGAREHRRRLREVPRHAPPRRHGGRHAGVVERRGARDHAQPGGRVRHHARLLRRHHADPALRTRLLDRRAGRRRRHRRS